MKDKIYTDYYGDKYVAAEPRQDEHDFTPYYWKLSGHPVSVGQMFLIEEDFPLLDGLTLKGDTLWSLGSIQSKDPKKQSQWIEKDAVLTVVLNNKNEEHGDSIKIKLDTLEKYFTVAQRVNEIDGELIKIPLSWRL